MTKILIPVLVVAALLLPVVSCGGSQHTPEEKYFLIGTNVKIPYWQQVGAGLAKAASEMHVKAEMVGPEGYDPKAQRDEFAKAVAQKPSGIMVSASDPSLKDDIDGAIAQGIPVITIDSDAPDSKRLTFIGTDNYKAGLMAGKVVARELKFRGAVTVFTMPEQNNLKERLHGYKDAFETYPQIKITQIVDAKGDPRIVSDTLTQDDRSERTVRGDPLPGLLCLSRGRRRSESQERDREDRDGDGH